MSITSPADLVDALANNPQPFLIDKASIANAAANQLHSLWRATGQPGQGGIPAAAALCTKATVGAALNFTNPTAPVKSYLGYLFLSSSNQAAHEIYDRIGHMGGLSGTVATAQTVNLDASSQGLNPGAARVGDASLRELLWFAEWYTDTGSTGVNLTVNVTFTDDSTANLTAVALAATRRASFLIPLNGLIQAADSGKIIKKINNCTLSATTGTAGSFGFTVARPLTAAVSEQTSRGRTYDWAELGLPQVPDDACIWFVQQARTTSTGNVRGRGIVAQK